MKQHQIIFAISAVLAWSGYLFLRPQSSDWSMLRGDYDEYPVLDQRSLLVERNPLPEPVVLLTCSDGFFDMWINWLKFFERLDIPDLPVHLFAEDNQTYHKCVRQVTDKEYDVDLTCLPWDFAFSRDTLVDDIGALGYESKGYKAMMGHRPSIIKRELELGRSVIFSDIDVVWKKDPLPYVQQEFRGASAEVHIIAADDKTKEGPGINLCPGFMIYRSCPETISFMELWQKRLGKSHFNQGPFNALIRGKARQAGVNIMAKPLPAKLFPNGKMYFDTLTEEERDDAYIVHNNWIEGHDAKLDRFKAFDLWLVDE